MKYSEMTFGRMEAVINKLGGMEGVDKLLRGELTLTEPKRNWREENGIIYFSVTSDGATGEGWIKRLEKKGYEIYPRDRFNAVCSPDFNPTTGVTTKVAILKKIIDGRPGRTTKEIRDFAAEHNLVAPNAEVACLIRENFSDWDIKAMGLNDIVVMHKPIKHPRSVNGKVLLSGGHSTGGHWPGVYGGDHDEWWDDDHNIGFAFAVSQDN